MTELIGWISSFILLATLTGQNWKQWRSGSVEGISKWLWVGQTAASCGFTTYSVQTTNEGRSYDNPAIRRGNGRP